MASDVENKDVVIYYNDSIDSDNTASALALALAVAHKPNTRVIWILEPRQVSLGLSMSKEETARCLELIKEHPSSARGTPFKILLGGLLEEKDLASFQCLDASDHELLQKAVKPPYGPKEDAVLHGHLAAWDLATCLTQWTGTPVEVLMDTESLDEIENPVNLNLHHHEELNSRSEGELRIHKAIMETKQHDPRADALRGWYRDCIKHAETRPENKGSSIQSLNVNSLCGTIKEARSVRFFGGSSLRILRQFIEKGVAKKVECSIQAVGKGLASTLLFERADSNEMLKGSCDLSANLFPNQFNIGVNPKAARFVLGRFTEFAAFTVVPSHSAQDIKYSLLGLKQAGGHCLEKRILGFNCREDPLKISTAEVTLEKDYLTKASPMPDLTAFLCALIPDYMGTKRGHVRIKDEQGVLLFEPAESGIPMYDLVNGKSLEDSEVVSVLNSLKGESG